MHQIGKKNLAPAITAAAENSHVPHLSTEVIAMKQDVLETSQC